MLVTKLDYDSVLQVLLISIPSLMLLELLYKILDTWVLYIFIFAQYPLS